VANDPRSRRSSGRARRCSLVVCSVRPHRLVSGSQRTPGPSPRLPVSNHHFRARESRASFV
jgi:hypothetical protein